MKFDNQLRHATGIIHTYRGGVPLHAWLKDFFREHPQMGSRDRKFLSQLVYGYYRLGHTLKEMPAEERILLGLFLCYPQASEKIYAQAGEFLQYFRPQWHERVTASLQEKIAYCQGTGIDLRPAEIFPWKEELSESIDHPAYCLSFLQQPDLFLRIRPGYEKEVLEKLQQHGVPYIFLPPFTLRLPNGFRTEELFTPDKEVVVQDYSSQRIGGFLTTGHSPLTTHHSPLTIWDACAASGGKSLLAHDLLPVADLTVSDIRDSILHNLRQRFGVAGIKNYHAFVADLTKPNPSIPARDFDLIITDVPCTGSGTWGRTPEELYFFDPKKIDQYAEWQRRIVQNTLPHLRKGGSLLYITCSVFKKENEAMVDLIRSSNPGAHMELQRVENIKGYGEKADTLFAAGFRDPLSDAR